MQVNNSTDIKEKYDLCTQKYDDAKKKSEYEELKKEFESFGDYEYAKDYIKLCDLRIKKQKKIHTIIGGIIGAGLLICIILTFVLIIPTIRYNNALLDYKNKKYDEAYKTFNALGDFKDSKFMAEYSNIRWSEVGDSVKFGDLSGETLEWRVLDIQKDKVLLVTKYLNDKLPYQEGAENNEHVTWEECSLRQYLNNEYYNWVFNKQEQNVIIASNLKQKDEPGTTDKVFILSYEELAKYFISNETRKAEIKNGSEAYTKWWMRNHYVDPDFGNYYIKCVNEFGEIGESTQSNVYGDATYGDAEIPEYVRPAIWVDISDK